MIACDLAERILRCAEAQTADTTRGLADEAEAASRRAADEVEGARLLHASRILRLRAAALDTGDPAMRARYRIARREFCGIPDEAP